MAFKSSWSVTVLSVLLSLAPVGVARATVELETLKEPVPVTLDVPVNTVSTPSKTPFSLQLADDVTYRGSRLPQGTTLMGTITEIRPSRRLGRPARFTVQFEEALLPSQGRFALPDAEAAPDQAVTFRRHTGKTFKTQFRRQLVINLVALAATVPLAVATDMDGWELFAANNAIDGLVGGVVEANSHDPDDNRSTAQKAAWGAFRGISILPFLYTLSKRSPDLNYAAGHQTMVEFPPALWRQLFYQAAQQSLPARAKL